MIEQGETDSLQKRSFIHLAGELGKWEINNTNVQSVDMLLVFLKVRLGCILKCNSGNSVQ